VPFVSTPLGKTTFQLTTSIGRSLQTYDVKRGLQLVFITSPQTPETITATTSWDKSIIAAWGNGQNSGVWVFKRGKQVGELEQPRGEHDAITQLLVFGPWIVGSRRDRIEIWKASTLEHYTTLQSPSQGVHGGFSGPICNMPTYLNKIFAGKQDGSVEIWNVSTGRLVYTLLPESAEYRGVTALQPTPALSILAIAYESGYLALRNVRTDEQVISFRATEDSRSAVSSISFRTDGMGAGDDGQLAGAMATSSMNTGDVTFWDLNKGGRKVGVLRGAHSPPSANGDVAGGISGIEYLPGQSILVSSGRDNAIKTWIFDDMPFSPIPKILHTRGGHAAPVSLLQFLPTQSDGSDSTGKWLMSSSHDRSFWGWSLRRDNQSTELSQGNIRKKAKKAGILSSSLDLSGRGTTLEELKAPRITSMASSLNRDGGVGALAGTTSIWTNDTKTKNKSDPASTTTGWESVVTGHQGDQFARTWFWGRKRAGRWKFQTSDSTPVSVSNLPLFTESGLIVYRALQYPHAVHSRLLAHLAAQLTCIISNLVFTDKDTQLNRPQHKLNVQNLKLL
jgi:U3 small nucleolar RNA-associated protein 21